MIRRAVPFLAVVALCAGCSGTSPGRAESPSQPAPPAADHGETVRTAIAATRAGTAHFETRHELGAEGKHFMLTMTGDFDFAGDLGHVAVDFPEGGISHIDEIFADGRVHVSNLPQTEGKWATMPRTAAEAHYVLRAPLNDPEHVLEQLASIHETTRVGAEDLDGTPTTHYRGALLEDAITLRITEKIRAGPPDIAPLFPDGRLSIPADVWLNSEGRVVRTRLTLQEAGMDVVATTTFSRHGTPVHVDTPKAEQTVPVDTIKGVLPG
ncbi:hypothetical protein B4N89_40755 [Embleya scabrispora]|uniref:LppX_LprAFG lipoprotein n=1 Tax=Embleya scabrispora TaxID=159449 RepID=A0A1T3NJB6_9ACTN|nr:hypothetical protein [Embleya scabrispora]OPC76929.1 hypothetical protein B4N89_40755 [Embleya scabrispora]